MTLYLIQRTCSLHLPSTSFENAVFFSCEVAVLMINQIKYCHPPVLSGFWPPDASRCSESAYPCRFWSWTAGQAGTVPLSKACAPPGDTLCAAQAAPAQSRPATTPSDNAEGEEMAFGNGWDPGAAAQPLFTSSCLSVMGQLRPTLPLQHF